MIELKALQEIEKRRTQKSNERLIVFGKYYELYEYQNEYFWNKPPQKRAITNNENINRNRRIDNLWQTRQTVQRIILGNADTQKTRPKFITYTFKKNITNITEANKIWTEYCRRLKKHFFNLKYLTVIEFQKRGAVHYHTLYFNMPYRKNLKKLISATWNNGFIKIISTNNIRNISLYVSKYIQKELTNTKLIRQKSYFCSTNLTRPITLKNKKHIAYFIQSCNIENTVSATYYSDKYGTIIHKKGNIYEPNNKRSYITISKRTSIQEQ